MKPNVLLSTGHGDLHFVAAARALTEAGCSVTLVQNWKPSPIAGRLLNFLGRMAGRNHVVRKQTCAGLPCRVVTCTGSKIVLSLLNAAARARLLSASLAARWGWLAYGWQSRRAIRGWQALSGTVNPVFHVRSGAGQGGAIRQAKALDLKVVVDQSLAHPAFMAKVLGRVWGPDDPFWRLVLRDCDEADLLLVNSEFVKETFVQSGYPAGKIRVVYLGVREDFFCDSHGGTENKEDGGRRTESREVRLLFTGRFGRRKGADTLLEAVRMLKERKVACSLSVVGDCEREYAACLAEAEGQGTVRHQAYVPQAELKRYIAEADIYVFPSRAEGCACSGMEAMAAGLCVVATRESGLPITHGDDGFVVPAGNAEALAQQLAWLATHPDVARAAGAKAMRKMREEMTWTRYAEHVTEVYAELTSAAPRQSERSRRP